MNEKGKIKTHTILHSIADPGHNAPNVTLISVVCSTTAKSAKYFGNPGPSQYKDDLSMYGTSNYKDKTVVRQSYLYNGNSYTGQTTSLYKPMVSHQDESHMWSFYVSFVFHLYKLSNNQSSCTLSETSWPSCGVTAMGRVMIIKWPFWHLFGVFSLCCGVCWSTTNTGQNRCETFKEINTKVPGMSALLKKKVISSQQAMRSIDVILTDSSFKYMIRHTYL